MFRKSCQFKTYNTFNLFKLEEGKDQIDNEFGRESAGEEGMIKNCLEDFTHLIKRDKEAERNMILLETDVKTQVIQDFLNELECIIFFI